MKLVSNSPNFAGTKPIKILGKDNKHVKYLYNDVITVSDSVREIVSEMTPNSYIIPQILA